MSYRTLIAIALALVGWGAIDLSGGVTAPAGGGGPPEFTAHVFSDEPSATNYDIDTTSLGLEVDDLLVLVVCADSSTQAFTDPTGGASGTWTEGYYGDGGSGIPGLGLAWKLVESGDIDATFNFAWSVSHTNEGVSLAVKITGNDDTSPGDAAGSGSGMSTGGPYITPSITVAEGSIALFLFCHDGAPAKTIDPPSGYVEGTDYEEIIGTYSPNSSVALGIAYDEDSSSGATGTRTWTVSSNDQAHGMSISFK